MKVSKVCQACEAEPGSFSCLKCGRVVGKKCWTGTLCKDCAGGVRSTG